VETPDHLPRDSKKTAGKLQAGSVSLDGDHGGSSATSPAVGTEHTSETDMTRSAHRAAESQSPAADVIRLPHRTVAGPAGPAIEPPGIPAYVPELLRRAAEDLAFAETVLQPGSEVPSRSGGPGRSGPAAPEDPGVPATAPDGTHVEVRMLGCFKIWRAGHDVASSSFGGRRSRQLLQILLTGRGRLIPKEVLIEALWPRRDPADPHGNLAVLASRARHALGEASLILSRPGGYLYADDDRTWVPPAFRRTVRLPLPAGQPPGGDGSRRRLASGDSAAESAPLAFGEPAPDPVLLPGGHRGHQACPSHRAAGADVLRFCDLRQCRRPGRADREEQLRVLAPAGRATTPAALIAARRVCCP
jgi:hypothetical protein